MKQILSLIFLIISFYSFNSSAQNIHESQIKSEGFTFNANFGFNRSVSGELEDENGRTRFDRDVNDNSGRFVLDTYFLANYFIFPQHFSIGLGTGISKSYKPNFVQIPIIIDLRGYIFQLEKNNALYLFLQYGQSPKIGDKLLKGNIFNIGVGYQFKFAEQFYSIELGNKGRGVSYNQESVRFSDHTASLRGYYIGVSYHF